MTVTSDNEIPLARRAGAVLLPFNQFGELFSVLRFTATSDGNPTPAGVTSDTLVVSIGSNQGGSFTGTLMEPPNEGTPEQPITFTLPAISYDVQEADGTISDYVNVSPPVTGFFLSSDDQAVYGQAPFSFPVDGMVTETNAGGGTLNFKLTFNSEPAVAYRTGAETIYRANVYYVNIAYILSFVESTMKTTSLPLPTWLLELDPISLEAQDPTATVVQWKPTDRDDAVRSIAKRVIDVVGAMAGLVLLFPIMMMIALLIRLDSPGPVLFRQLRQGRDGRPFWFLKFRTMIPDAEHRLGELEALNESAGRVLFKIRRDPRVTRLGRFLRRSSLDELPQLINVLRGEMSLVGPRPLQLRDCERLKEQDPEGVALRLSVLPGLTGAWQVGGRSETDSQGMLQLDLNYIEHWSLRLDLWILCRTVVVVLLGRGAY